MPPCTIIPVLVYPNVAEAITWLSQQFGFEERWRIGNHRAQLTLGEDTIAISEPLRSLDQYGKPVSHSLLVRVEDVAGHYEHVKKNGGRIIHPPADFPYGERQYTVSDIGGHNWTFSQSLVDLSPEDWGGTTPTSSATQP